MPKSKHSKTYRDWKKKNNKLRAEEKQIKNRKRRGFSVAMPKSRKSKPKKIRE